MGVVTSLQSPLPTYFTVPDCRFELALEVQRWTRARSECLPGRPNIIDTPLLSRQSKIELPYAHFLSTSHSEIFAGLPLVLVV